MGQVFSPEMEVETQARSSFELGSKPSVFSYIDHSELRNSEPRSFDMSGPSESPNFLPPVEERLKCESFDHPLELVSVTDALSPAESGLQCNESNVSKSAAAKKLQKVYRSYRTRRMLADSAVVVEELWWQALDYARLNHSTISFFNFLKPETAASRWNRITLNASKVGKGLSKDAKAQKLAFRHWIEAIDPRHRYGHSLHIYYEEWCKSKAGQPFFYWLDLGEGKKVDLKECPRSKLQKQCIKYLGPQEREYYEYLVIEGKIVHKQTGNLLDTGETVPGAKWIFVMSTTKRLYAGEKKKGLFHHSSFLAGGATLAAGRLEVDDGILKFISPYSGHYRPTDDSFNIFKSFLKENGVELDQVEMRKANENYENYGDGKLAKDTIASDVSTVSDTSQHDYPQEEEPSEPVELPQARSTVTYQRTLSGGLQSPKTEVPKTAILQRINSKKVNSYELGKQLSLKWSTGAGPRIGCVADYPIELRLQALEFTNLSPSMSPSATPGWIPALVSPSSYPSAAIGNGNMTSA